VLVGGTGALVGVGGVGVDVGGAGGLAGETSVVLVGAAGRAVGGVGVEAHATIAWHSKRAPTTIRRRDILFTRSRIWNLSQGRW
jgi:hypothetical protein